MAMQGEAGLIIFDLEGTLISSYMKNPDREYHRWHLLPGRAERLRQLQAEGWVIGVASNQAGVAFGHIVEADFQRKIAEVAEQLGVQFEYRVCYHHQRATISVYRDPLAVLRRKPGGAMLAELIAQHRAAAYRQCLYVGDAEEDEQAAQHVAIPFIWSWHFFGDQEQGVTYHLPVERIF